MRGARARQRPAAARCGRAQTAAPTVEIGVDAAALLLNRGSGPAAGPRLVVNFDGRNALELTATLQPLAPYNGVAEQRTDLYLVTFKRVVYASGRARAFTTLGGGVDRTLIVVPPITFGGPPPVTFPGSRGREVFPAATIGGGVDVGLAPYAALTMQASVVFSSRIDGRFSGGLVVPVRAYSVPRTPLAASVPWAGVSEGDHVWVTTAESREVAGEVVLRSATRLGVRPPTGVIALAPDDVFAIDTTDPIRNGLVLGTKIGAVGALGWSVLLSYVLCAFEENCSAAEVVALNAVIVGMGAGIGASVGALADSLRQRRAPLYRRGASSVSIAPQIRHRSLGVSAAIRW